MTRPAPKGQSMVELAIIFPVLFLILAGVIQFGVLFWSQNSLNQIVRDTGRTAATQGACNGGAANAIIAEANKIGAGAALLAHNAPWTNADIDVSWPTTDANGVMYDGDGDGVLDPCPTMNNHQIRYVRIVIRHQAPIFFPWLPGNGAMSATAEYRIEPINP